MELFPIIYSHKIHSFNVSDDLRHIVFSSDSLYHGELNTGNVKKLVKGKGHYESCFSADKAFLVTNSHYLGYRFSDSFTIKTNIGKEKQNLVFAQVKPIIYSNNAYMFIDFADETAIENLIPLKNSENFCFSQYKSNKSRTNSSENIYIFLNSEANLHSLQWSVADSKIIDNALYSIYVHLPDKGGYDKIRIYRFNISSFDFEMQEFALPTKMICRNLKIIPQKNLIAVLGVGEKCCHISYFDIKTFKLVNNVDFDCILSQLMLMQTLCEGRFIVCSHANGFDIHNTETLRCEKSVHLPMITSIKVCDNDNFCAVFSPFDCVVFSPIASEQNKILSKKIENCFEHNGLGNLIAH